MCMISDVTSMPCVEICHVCRPFSPVCPLLVQGFPSLPCLIAPMCAVEWFIILVSHKNKAISVSATKTMPASWSHKKKNTSRSPALPALLDFSCASGFHERLDLCLWNEEQHGSTMDLSWDFNGDFLRIWMGLCWGKSLIWLVGKGIPSSWIVIISK